MQIDTKSFDFLYTTLKHNVKLNKKGRERDILKYLKNEKKEQTQKYKINIEVIKEYLDLINTFHNINDIKREITKTDNSPIIQSEPSIPNISVLPIKSSLPSKPEPLSITALQKAQQTTDALQKQFDKIKTQNANLISQIFPKQDLDIFNQLSKEISDAVRSG